VAHQNSTSAELLSASLTNPSANNSASSIADRLGFTQNEALTLVQALAGLNAKAKGQRLGSER
jgi:hypothetical protein